MCVCVCMGRGGGGHMFYVNMLIYIASMVFIAVSISALFFECVLGLKPWHFC